MYNVFALDRSGRRVMLANGIICDWMVDIFGGPLTVPPVSKWYQIPDEHLHPRLDVAYVNFIDFIEEVGLDVVQNIIDDDHREPDPRPLITPQFREQNNVEWLRLWDLNRTEECPVCHERPDMWDMPMNSDIPTRCTHWICVECWSRINDRDKRCPICRDDLTDWLSHFDNMSE